MLTPNCHIIPSWWSRGALARSVGAIVVFATAGILFAPAPGEAQGIAGILTKLDALEVRIGELETAGPAVTSAPVSGSTLDSETLASSIAEIRDELGGLEYNVAALRGDGDVVETLASRIEAVETLASRVEAVETLASRIEAFEALVSKIEAIERALAEQSDDDAEPPAAEASRTVSISSFVDASYYGDQASTPASTFGLDQVEVDLEVVIGSGGSFRFDLEWVNDGAGGFVLDVEQGFLGFAPFADKPLTVSFGKFNAPIGFELLDAPDMYQFSHALVFNLGLPTNLTGAMVAGDLGGGWNFAAYASNGWDENQDLSSGKTFGGRLGVPLGQKASGGLSAIHDAGSIAGVEGLTIFDSDLTITPRDDLVLGFEVNAGRWASGGDGLLWAGVLAMAHYDVNESFGLTFRYDYFDDREGLRLGVVGAEKRAAFTLAPTFVLGNGMGALIEIRSDRSNTDGFLDSEGLPTESIISVAFEMTYTFDQLLR